MTAVHRVLLLGIAASVTLAAAYTDILPVPGADDATVVSSLADGRTGRVRFRSYQPTMRELRRGQVRRSPIAVPGTLELPTATGGPVPAVVLIHGSDGVSSLQRRYARALRRRGMATFVLDSFAPRNVASTIGSQDAVPLHAMVVDLFAALDLLAGHPRVDANRIAVIGWSKGGVAADWASREWYRARLARGDRRFAAHVAFYAWCGEQDARIALTGAPLLHMGGALDDWAGSDACVRYARRAGRAGFDVRAVTYPDAHHGFDYDGSFNKFLPNAVSWADCEYLARETGFVERRSGRFGPWPDLGEYLARCGRTGVHVASNAGARASAALTLMAFLSESLGTPPGGAD